MTTTRRTNPPLSTAVIILAFYASASCGFQPPLSTTSTYELHSGHRSIDPHHLFGCAARHSAYNRCHVVLDLWFRKNNPESHNGNVDGPKPQSLKKKARRFLRKFTVGLATIALTTLAPLKYNIKEASASAPVMAIPKAEGRDPATEAMLEMERRQAREAQKELNEFATEARKIEAEQGEAARMKFEQDYKANKNRKAEEKAIGLVSLKRELLAQGICPFVDMEGQRQVIAYRSGVDLSKTPGTPFYMEKILDKKNSKKAYSYRKEVNRRVIACMVEDMKNRDIDPLEYFEKHQDQTETILALTRDKATQLVERYTTNLELYGQITTPKPGEISAKEKMEAKRDPKAEAKRLKEEKRAEAKRLKEEKRAKAAELKASQRAERERKREEAKLQNENAKKRSKVAVGAASATVALGTSAMKDSATKIADNLDSAVNSLSGGPRQATTDHSSSSLDTGYADYTTKTRNENSPPRKSSSVSGKLISPKAIGSIAIVGGGAFAFKLYRDRAAADEIARQKQFEFLMGNSEVMKPDAEESDDALLDNEGDSMSGVSPFASLESPTPPAAPAKKRRLGIGLFNKKSNRETNIEKLVGPSSLNADFANSLAKLLTFGAPGRFPSVDALPGSMPMDDYDLTSATALLLEVKGDLSQKDLVELFASVVTCMLIDILDLASSALSIKKGKDEATVEALNIVVDFMNHAAELFGAVAGNDVLMDPPVRYEGSLSKSKLEQMYGIYASAGADMSMLFPKEGEQAEVSPNVRDDHDQRVAMLQDVFGISDKKAQGITMKAAQKTMMEMAKSGKMQEMIEQMGGAEGMEEMMKQMGGMEDMDPAMIEAMADPEKLLPELKRIQGMVKAGTFPKSELKEIQEQFRTAFGSDDIETALLEGRDTAELTKTEKEFLEAMKVIMEAV